VTILIEKHSKEKSILTHYQTTLLGRIFAKHGKFVSLDILENKLAIRQLVSKKDIPFLDIDSIYVEKGYIWNTLIIYLQDGGVYQLGGINKSKSIALEKAFNDKKLTFLERVAKNLSPMVNEAYIASKAFLSGNQYIRHAKPGMWLETYNKPLSVLLSEPDLLEKLPAQSQSQFSAIHDLLRGKGDYIANLNKAFVEQQLEAYKGYFDTVESNPLTLNQRKSCVIDERYNLVLAGAGTGKTSTIVARAGYLVKSGLAKPDEILLLAFGNEAAKEMDTRIREKLQFDDLTAKTFHSFGQSIIAAVEQKKPSISNMATDDSPYKSFVDSTLREFLTRDDYQSSALTYLLYEKHPYKNPFSFKTLKAYNQYIQENELRTFQKELVKSYEELLIANFLFQQGINYQYEANYQINTATADFRAYQPDFYLPDYGIYIEHFGVDENDNTPPFIDKTKYVEGMRWKRELHQKHQTILVETYSYEKRQGILLESLAEKLQQHGVEFKPIANNALLSKLEELGEILDLSKLLAELLSQFKTSNASITQLTESSQKGGYKSILKLFKPLYESYEKQLKQTQTIDFNDMISKATGYIINGRYQSPYKYIMVDEFQDISAPRNALIKALLDQDPDNGFYCVGDDWQSIYRFTGSDINIIAEFEKNYGFAATTILDKTFRFNNKIGDVASKFIQCNPIQFIKKIESHQIVEAPAVSLLKTNNTNYGLNAALSSISSRVNRPVTVLILARFHFRFKDLELKAIKRNYPNLQVITQSIHASKGKEADYVIIIGLEKGKFGLPSTKITHPLLELLLPKLEAFPYSEERRVFYVALTRAKHHVYLITNPNNPSIFVRELLKNKYEISDNEFNGKGFSPKLVEKLCERCEVGYMVPRDGQHGKFLACNNPACNNTESGCDWCKSALIKEGNFRVCENPKCDFKQPVCPQCGAGLKLRSGQYGKFWGCTHYRSGNEFSCGYTEKFIEL